MRPEKGDELRTYDLHGWLTSIIKGTKGEEGRGVYRMDALENMSRSISEMPEIDQREVLEGPLTG